MDVHALWDVGLCLLDAEPEDGEQVGEGVEGVVGVSAYSRPLKSST